MLRPVVVYDETFAAELQMLDMVNMVWKLVNNCIRSSPRKAKLGEMSSRNRWAVQQECVRLREHDALHSRIVIIILLGLLAFGIICNSCHMSCL